MKKHRLIHLYVTTVSLAALMALAALDWSALSFGSNASLLGFVVLMGFGLLSEHQTVKTALGERGGSHSITFIPLSAAVVLFGPIAPALFIAIVGTLAEFLIRRRSLQRGAFNVSQFLLSSVVAGWVYGALGGKALAVTTEFEVQFLPFAAFGVTLLVLNQTFVALAISLSQGVRFTEVIQKVAGPTGAAAVYDLLISPVALILAFLFLQAGVAGLSLAVLPLFFIRHAYVLNFRLQQANRDLLTALVKAIETRDPYTSGHSLRVQALASRIAAGLGLPEYRRRNIEQAALLHDVGKIDAIYTEILEKRAGLSKAEREVIESHVTKGVELLTSLSSFPTEVVDAVRYHHEREDGKGYPHGITGDAIPLGAKIINVCDAVDAMLSDRPYRKALSIDSVREELTRYSGIQFDRRVVSLVVDGDLLELHRTQVLEEMGGIPTVPRDPQIDGLRMSEATPEGLPPDPREASSRRGISR